MSILHRKVLRTWVACCSETLRLHLEATMPGLELAPSRGSGLKILDIGRRMHCCGCSTVFLRNLNVVAIATHDAQTFQEESA